jgi:hypothetical protein
MHESPAPYALPKGTPALQTDPARTRRGFVLCALGGLLTGVALACTWSRDGTARGADRAPPPPPRDPRYEWLVRALAGPAESLVEQQELLLALAIQFRTDPRVRAGIARMSEAALAGSTRRHEQLSLRLLDYLAADEAADPDGRAARAKLEARLARAQEEDR